MKIRNLGILAVATMFVVGSTGTAVLAVPSEESPDSSAASITLSDCVVDSSKEISNVEYFADGESVTKDETLNTSSLDLTTVGDIETIDAISVKAGTTVESFDVTCAPATAPEDGDGASGGTGTPDEEAPAPAPAPEDGSDGDDGAVITLSGCALNSTKDISNIEYYSGEALVAKDESMNTLSYDLTTVEGIENIDTITVKSSTTVETFAISCAPASQPESEEATADNGEDAATTS